MPVTMDENMTPLELMMVDRLVLAWASACCIYVLAGSTSGVAEPAMLKALESAERRCQTAMKTLQLAGAIARGKRGKQRGASTFRGRR